METGLFWAIAIALALMVAVVLVQALRRGGDTAETHPDLKVYKDQLSEVDRDLSRGTLTAEEAQRLRTEVSRRLLEADRATGAQTAPAPHGNLVWAGALLMVGLGGSLALYDRLGAPGYADLPLSLRLDLADDAYRSRPSQADAEVDAPLAPTAQASAEFLGLMDKLRAAVIARPDDVQGLELLARNETALGNFAPALTAQTRLIEILGDAASPAQRLMAAQIMVAAAGGYVSPEAEAVLVDVLQRDPQNGMARYLSGLMFAQVGRPDRAFALWQPLLDESPEGAPWVQPILTDIQAVADQAGIKFSLPDGKGPSIAEIDAAGEMTPAERQAMIEGMVVQLEERLMSEGGPLDDWLKLINALGVLGQTDRGKAALTSAEAAMAADPTGLKAVRDAAAVAGFAP